MKQKDIKQFKFEGRKCTGFSLTLENREIVFTRDLNAEAQDEYCSLIGEIWQVQILNFVNILPMLFETPKKGMSLSKIAAFGLSILLKQIRDVQGELEDVAININKELLVTDNGK